jgi:hypothetical protein
MVETTGEQMMGRYAKDSGDFRPAPAGTHLAVCVGIIDLGTSDSEYQGAVRRRNQIIIRWELPDALMDDGQPFLVSAWFTNSLNEKSTLRHALETWRGREFTPKELQGFDLESILGKQCMLSIIHKDGKARVNAVMAAPQGTPKRTCYNLPSAFWIDPWDQKAFEALPQGFQRLIMASEEYATRSNPGPVSDAHFTGTIQDMADDVPF